MADTPRKVAITKPGGGSFARPKNEIEAEIRADRAQSQLEQAQSDAEDRRAQEEDKKRVEEINRLLPGTVMSSHGQISYKLFKEIYTDIWRQVREKDHLTTGYCTYSSEIFEGVEARLRTFRSGEAKVLFRWAPDLSSDGMIIDQGQDSHFRNMRLVVALTMFDGQDLKPVPDILKYEGQDIQKWLDDEIVTEKLKWIERMPDEVVFFLGGVQADISNAYRFALRENLKNQLAPPSHS